MACYAYPAIFTPEEEGYTVNFPVLEGCYTEGDDLADALYMAEDALALVLYGYEKDGLPIPAPSQSFTLNDGEFISYVACDTMEYRKMYNNKAVKKTLTIPEWLNEETNAIGVNFLS